jgi:1-acyl-sn-glycerol-3-phosphate acyltransferase
VQCLSIRLLLRLQPWLRCETNFHGILGFYERFHTRKILFVANHRSNLDTFLLISYIPGLRGLAKSSLFYNIFFAPFMYVAGFIPVDKGSPESLLKGLKRLREKLLERNRSVLIFPETTRCEKGFPSVHKFGASFFSLAIDSHALVVPLAIECTDQLMGRGDFLLNPFQPVKIKMLEPVDATQFKDSVELRDLVWNQVKAELT